MFDRFGVKFEAFLDSFLGHFEGSWSHFCTPGTSWSTSWLQDHPWTLPGPFRRASWSLLELILGPT